MDDLKVSIITPSYNCAEWLPTMIESVLGQTYGNFELLIVDDGSSDNTRDEIQPYLSDERVKYFFQQNAGQATARNHGLREATGEYVAYLDADDTWEPAKLEKQIKLLRDQDIQLCYTDITLLDENGEVFEYEPEGALVPRRGWVLKHLFMDNFITFSSVVIEKKYLEKVGGSDVSVKKSDDWDLLLRLSVFCKFGYIDEKLTNYQLVRDGHLSGDIKGRFESISNIASRFIENNPGILPVSHIKKAYAYRCGQYANAVFDENIKESLRYYGRSVANDPFCPDIYRKIVANVLKSVAKR